MVLDQLNPKSVFAFFEELCAIPHGSGNEKAISDHLVDFAKARGLRVVQDGANNVYIQKPGTPGYETAPGVVLQGHMDMVCDKNKDTVHDFLTQGLELYLDGDFIRARGTTLGADNGIAVAMAMALLDSRDIPHPPLEAVITTDEEVGMTGATAFDGSLIQGKYLINLDNEGDTTLLVSCCGGIRADFHLPVEREAVRGKSPKSIQIKGLKGGHSGQEIHMQHANAIVLLGRVLSKLQESFDYRLHSLFGGSADNVICREAEALVFLAEADVPAVEACLADLAVTFNHEFKAVEEGITVTLSPAESASVAFTQASRDKIVAVLTLLPYGVATMSQTMDNLVESSSNPGVLRTEDKEVRISTSIRSSVLSRKYVILDKIKAVAALTGGTVTTRGAYPGWEYNPNSYLLKVFQETYRELFHGEPEILAIHAGVECGIFGAKKDLDMISLGPNMYDIHTPEERLSISSTARCWNYLLTVLAKLK